jgi:probable aminopeptidase NPEPL1
LYVQYGDLFSQIMATINVDFTPLSRTDTRHVLIVASSAQDAIAAAKDSLAACGIAELPWVLLAIQSMRASAEAVSTTDFTLPKINDEAADEGSSLSSTVRLIVCLLPSNRAARHNSPSKPHVVSSIVKTYRSSGNCLIVLVPELAEYAFSQACAVARCFPLHTMKTTNYGRDKVSNHSIVNLVVSIPADYQTGELLESIRLTIAQIRLCQELVDAPPNILTTTQYVNIATTTAKDLGCDVTVISGDQLKEQGLGGLFAVGQASVHPPALVVLSWYPPDGRGGVHTDLPSICLVGKGIVYDTGEVMMHMNASWLSCTVHWTYCLTIPGGLSIKTPTSSMAGMKMDMGGSAAVLGSFVCAVKMHQTTTRKLLKPLHALLCIAENSVDERSMRPDDVITLLSGRTVEVNNTDAEGRLVLADGCCYAARYLNPEAIIDMATLTGAQLVATGGLNETHHIPTYLSIYLTTYLL